MTTALDRKIRESLSKATGMEISEKLDPIKIESWWDPLHPTAKTDVLEKLGYHKGATVVLKTHAAFEELAPEWQTEVEAYWKKNVLLKIKRKGEKSEGVLGERFTSGDVRTAGKEAATQMKGLKSGTETAIRSRLKSMHWKKIIAAVDDVFEDMKKKDEKVGKQDVANVLTMMIRTEIEKEREKK
jgi:hypothetical protein